MNRGERSLRDDGAAAPLTLLRLVENRDVRGLLGNHMDAVSFWVASRLVCRAAPLVELDQAAFDRLLWGTASPADAFREARFLGHPHLRPQNPILAAGLADWLTGTEPSEAYCARALAEGSLELLAWARANGCPWSAAVRDAVTQLRVPDGTYSIHPHAFAGCQWLSSITLPDGIAALGDFVFQNCISLHTAVLPSSISKLGEFTFDGCPALAGITLPASLIALGNYTFRGTGLAEIMVPAGVAALGAHTFDGCHELRSVTLESARTLPGYTTFWKCDVLTRILVPPGLRQAEFDRLLWSTDSPAAAEWLAGLLGPPHLHLRPLNPILAAQLTQWDTDDYCVRALARGSLELLGWALARGYNCSMPVRGHITALSVPDGITELHSSTFRFCYELRSVALSADITSLGPNAFMDCRTLALVTLPPRLRTIGKWTFRGCHALRSITLSPKLTAIGRAAFANCRALLSIRIPDGVAMLATSTFRDCTALRTVYLPGRLRSIHTSVFEGCSSLRTVWAPRGLPDHVLEQVEASLPPGAAVAYGSRRWS